MTKRKPSFLQNGALLLTLFLLWTWLIRTVDVQPVGPGGTTVGFATLNSRFHECTGVHMGIYTATDWLGLVPIAVCLLFAGLGLLQLIRRRKLRKVDGDILLLGIYYVLVIGCYLAFEMYPVNYRPILIAGRLEASYPSSTTLLVLSVMPTLTFQAQRRWKHAAVIRLLTTLFSVAMILGRLISGVHWLTDIVGSLLLSGGLYCLYRAAVLLWEQKS